jgi:hypothetical protein
MSDKQQRGHRSLGPSPGSPLLAEFKAQCERLQQVAQRLEEEKQRDTEALAAVQAELQEYQRFLYDWAHRQVREEDWRDFTEADYTIAAEETIAELERQEGS